MTWAIAILLISKCYSFHGVYPTDMLQTTVTAPAAYVPYYQELRFCGINLGNMTTDNNIYTNLRIFAIVSRVK